MNDLFVFFACHFDLIVNERFLLAGLPRLESVEPGVDSALVGEKVAVGHGELHREQGVADFLLEGRRIVHQLVRDTEGLRIDARYWETCQGQERAYFTWQPAQIV